MTADEDLKVAGKKGYGPRANDERDTLTHTHTQTGGGGNTSKKNRKFCHQHSARQPVSRSAG